jgi:hypothetical protein
MPRFRVAHLRKQGQDMVIFPLDSTFRSKPDSEKAKILVQLQRGAHAAGLAGQAVAAWESGEETRFLGPRPWRPFFESIDMNWVLANVNKEISW